jgi:hypothetical protein
MASTCEIVSSRSDNFPRQSGRHGPITFPVNRAVTFDNVPVNRVVMLRQCPP